LLLTKRPPLTDAVVAYLQVKGYEVTLLGHLSDEKKLWKWAEIGTEVGKQVAIISDTQAVLFCWSGTGVCMAANKVSGIRAALCWDAETARLARKWDDANVLCLSLRFTSEAVAKEIIDSWLTTTFDEENLGQVAILK